MRGHSNRKADYAALTSEIVNFLPWATKREKVREKDRKSKGSGEFRSAKGRVKRRDTARVRVLEGISVTRGQQYLRGATCSKPIQIYSPPLLCTGGFQPKVWH